MYICNMIGKLIEQITHTHMRIWNIADHELMLDEETFPVQNRKKKLLENVSHRNSYLIVSTPDDAYMPIFTYTYSLLTMSICA